ncbi:MAG: glucan biosynthesis protein G [Candidatus Omnitrophica bacterium]|nr:glucan biosynthesis protein G [Candidatus Omnitrophota bacterium]
MNNEDVLFQRTVFRSWLVIFGLFLFLFLMAPSFAIASGKNKADPYVRFQDVVAKAKALAEGSFQPPGQDLPDVLKKMGYDQWRDIHFKPANSLWFNEPFSVQFFHPGFLYQHPVTVHYVDQAGTHLVSFSPNFFQYAGTDLKGALLGDYGFAGFRIHYPLNTPQYADELVAFLGASYFRALGRGLAYGMSARGLAINTAEDTGEEFPLFREFWLVHPSSGAKSITFYALLDSESVTGAYEFIVTPGEETLMKVSSVLYVRGHIEKLGLAPLTSMFCYGENTGFKGSSDFRPEVHDSDGLLLRTQSGEWLWHPLVNPQKLLINAFAGMPMGFGLIQRDIKFDHYQDLEARYEKRPSVWVTPKGDWGKGHLELIQLPTETEYNDNIGAYWVPERALEHGDTLQFAYTLSWHAAQKPRSSQGFVESTRIVKKSDGAMFLIDFLGDEFKTVLANRTIDPDVWVSQGARITSSQLIKNTATGGWRLVIHIQLDNPGLIEGLLPTQKPSIEMRAFLKSKDLPVTETWSYTYLP